MVNCDDDRSEDSVMALIDLTPMHRRFVAQVQNILQVAEVAWDRGDREHVYLQLALASATLDKVLAVIEEPKDKPRNESPNGPLRASKNG